MYFFKQGVSSAGSASSDPKSRVSLIISSFVLEADAPIDFMVFQEWLEMVLATQGENLLRLKGIMDVKDVDRPVAIHGVQHIFHPPAALENWEGMDKRTRLVFITKSLSEQAIRDTFAAYLPGTLIEDE